MAASKPDARRAALALCALLAAGSVSAEPLSAVADRTAGYLEHARSGDKPIRSIVAFNPHAMADARAKDVEAASGRALGPAHGMVVLLKDNIESQDGTATTAGSVALADNRPARDAPLVRRLTDAGVVILGKTNLSEWANFRSSDSISGWSAIRGQTVNPVDPPSDGGPIGGGTVDPAKPPRSPCGSSSGSAAAIAARFADAAVGTETDGSITCPAAMAGLVGLKPTVGLVSRTGVIPISATQDTPGSIAPNVRLAAILLGAMAGSDPADPATAEADRHKTDYAAALDADALKGARLGVLKYATGYHTGTQAQFDSAVERLRAAGAEVVVVDDVQKPADLDDLEFTVLLTEFKAGVNAYLASTDPAQVKTRTLADLIAFNRDHAATEMPLFGQDIFERAQATAGLSDPAYLKAKADAHRIAGPEGIDAILARHRLDAIIFPTVGPAWLIDPVVGDHFVGGGGGTLPAVAGYPHLTVPMGEVGGLPVGLSFVGAAWSEAKLLSLGYAFEAVRAAPQ